MSRHKSIKALDLDEELNEFDGDDDGEDELSPEDQEQLRQGLLDVRNSIGPNVPFTDKEIEDSLYYYYFDAQKTSNYLINQTTKNLLTQSKNNKITNSNPKGVKDSQVDLGLSIARKVVPSCGGHMSAEHFFKDSPWLNIPIHRRGEIIAQPLHPHGGLLGGSPTSDGPPKSRLATLAAARKRKENPKPDGAKEMSNLALLSQNSSSTFQTVEARADRNRSVASIGMPAFLPPERPHDRPKSREGIQSRSKRETASRASGAALQAFTQPGSHSRPTSKPTAPPSTFAQSIFGQSMQGNPNYCPLRPLFSASVNLGPRANRMAFPGPSPDDKVLKAQTPSKGPNRNTISDRNITNEKEANRALKENIKSLSIDDAPKIRGKRSDVLHEYDVSKQKRAASFVVIGHVDAGKSTLMGRLLKDLKMIDQRIVDRYQKEAERIGKGSFALAWILDQGTEERERGVTIHVAINKFETEKNVFTILDAPGHSDFIPNMIAGASQADFAVLVIDASTGNFESGLKGQTKEHALLVRSMGVQRVVVAVNKLDAVQWSQDRFDEITQQISAFLTTAGFLTKNISFVPCSGLTGDNVVRRSTNELPTWYNGPPLLSLLESSEPIARDTEKPLRYTIDDVFRGGVQNPLSVSGRIDSGTVETGDLILVLPSNQTALIKGLEVDNVAAEWAVAGQNAILHLADIETRHLKAGDVICSTSSPVPCITRLTVKVLAFEHIMPMHCEVHKGRLHVPGRVTRLISILDKSSGVATMGKKPRLIKPGNVARVMVEVDDALPLESGSRIILRAGGETLGAGLLE